MSKVEEIVDWTPPPSRVLERKTNPQERYTKVVERLRASKGQWAQLAPRDSEQGARSLAANINKGRLASFSPQGAFEAVHEFKNVWVRYLGEPDGAAPPLPGTTRLNPSSATVRAWARATGRPVNHQGRISDRLMAEWYAATKGHSGTTSDDGGAPDAHEPRLG